MKKVLIFGAVLLLALVSPALAQEEEWDVAFGTVVSAGADRIVITEYDYELEKETDVTYYIDQETRYENIGGPAELNAGDAVEIVYLMKDGKKTAETVKKEMLLETDDGMGWDEDTPEKDI